MRARKVLRRYIKERGRYFTHEDLEHYMLATYGDYMPRVIDRIMRLKCVEDAGNGFYAAYPYEIDHKGLARVVIAIAIYAACVAYWMHSEGLL